MRKCLFIGLVAVLGLIGCSRNQEIDVPDANLSIFARTESPAETKTIVESGVHVYWEPGDEIAVFMGEQSAKFTTDITATSGTATFKGTFGDATWPDDLDLWAVYPFSEEAVFDGETITTTLPSEQVAREGSFGKDMNLAIAHSNSSTLQFYNVGGGIRFSVTEEGIKKAMFEGLSGEIISGKVKIGMDENGKPEVREVTGGSQFITLLPPTGQETFEPGAWYYIVAIPGSLEGGYKMRFYKDEDYARKVSEKAVVIKRSVFGNVEKADEGIEYEATTTKFPETEEEWSKSVQLTEEATDEITRIVFTDNNNRSIEELVDAVQKVDGVINVKMNSDASVMMVLQRDSIWINVLLKEFSSQEEIEPQTETANSIPMASPRANLGAQDSGTELSSILKEESFFPKRDSALIFAPFEDANENIDDWVKILNRIFKKVRVLKNDQASIEYCKEEVLSRYDYIIFSTHGIDGYYLYFKGIFDFQNIKTGYCLCTGTRYTIGGLEAGRLFINEGFRPEELCVTLRSNGKRYFGVTSQFFQRKLLQDKVFILSACSSAFNINNSSEDDPNGSIMRALLNNGARLVAGTRDSVYPSVSGTLNKYLLLYMEQGLSFQTAYEYIQHSEKTKKAMDELNTWVTPDPEYIHWDLGNNYMYIPNPNTNNEPYFFIDPFPTALKDDDDISGSVYTRDLSWDCNLKTFEIEWFDTIYESSGKKRWKMKYYTYSVHYDVYINGELAAPELILKKTKWTAPAPGKYDWYVVAKIIEGSTVIASYQSGVSSFIIKDETPAEPESIDLGLSVKWASFNLGATKPEEYGDYFAWGELEPYYSSQNPLTWKSGKEIGYFWDSYKWCMGDNHSLTKYCNKSSSGYNGFVDYRTILDPNDDAAHVILGEKWRTPTKEEWAELRNQCSWEWTTQEGYNGYKVIGKNGKFIFLPAAGSRAYSYVQALGAYGYYGSSSLYTNEPGCTNNFYFGSSYLSENYCGRYLGVTIRPVYGDAISVESVTLNSSQIDLIVGTNKTLTVTILPENAANKDYFWSSDNPSIATVSPEGVVKGIAVGTASISVTTYDAQKTATCLVSVIEQPQYLPSIPEAIDLGLSVKWGSLNLGATKPEEHGDYFAWGEIEPYYFSLDPPVWKPGKEAGYTWQSYKWWRGSDDTIAKYNASDGKTELDPEDDAAHMTLGDKWRMPIKAEWEELLRKCSTEWMSVDGISVFKVTGPNGNFIYIPSGGDCYETYFRFDRSADYWLPTNNPQSLHCANLVYLEPGYVGWSYMNRCAGHTIRPVYGDRKILSDGDIEGTEEDPWN